MAPPPLSQIINHRSNLDRITHPHERVIGGLWDLLSLNQIRIKKKKHTASSGTFNIFTDLENSQAHQWSAVTGWNHEFCICPQPQPPLKYPYSKHSNMQVEVQDVGTFKRLRKNVAIKWYLFACLRLSQHTMVALLARLDYEWFHRVFLVMWYCSPMARSENERSVFPTKHKIQRKVYRCNARAAINNGILAFVILWSVLVSIWRIMTSL